MKPKGIHSPSHFSPRSPRGSPRRPSGHIFSCVLKPLAQGWGPVAEGRQPSPCYAPPDRTGLPLHPLVQPLEPLHLPLSPKR